MKEKEERRLPQPYIVELGERSYPVYVGLGLIRSVGALLRKHLPSVDRCAVVTSDPIWEAHGEGLQESLENGEIGVAKVAVPDGEEAKSWDVAEKLIGRLLEHDLDRQAAILGFGGGAVGDLAGFVASIYLRGVSLVQAPTTLLSQVDSSLGGKTAVNHPKGKNLIGSIYQPSLVISDTNLLQTLPRREILSGLGEVVKHGVIADKPLFHFVEENGDKLVDADPDALAYIVKRSVAIKGPLVAQDERDVSGLRAVLNYGHTTGHALETLSRREMRHGEAVALGMLVASRISESLGLVTGETMGRQRKLLDSLGFSLTPPSFTAAEVVALMHRDKKAMRGSVRFVLPTGIGTPPVLRAVPDHLLISALEDEGYG